MYVRFCFHDFSFSQTCTMNTGNMRGDAKSNLSWYVSAVYHLKQLQQWRCQNNKTRETRQEWRNDESNNSAKMAVEWKGGKILQQNYFGFPTAKTIYIYISQHNQRIQEYKWKLYITTILQLFALTCSFHNVCFIASDRLLRPFNRTSVRCWTGALTSYTWISTGHLSKSLFPLRSAITNTRTVTQADSAATNQNGKNAHPMNPALNINVRQTVS